MKILILGGYGVFGGRLAELLSDIPTLELLICGRNRARAEAFCARYHGCARAFPVQLDRTNIGREIENSRPDLVVDASGPFQDYVDTRYAVIEACIASGTNYLDFADAADFVFGVSQFDEAAKAAGVFVMSGVSSFPVLTAAVVRQLAKTMDVTGVEGGIAPSPYAGIGLNVMRAVVGYAGSPVQLIRNGLETHASGLVESRRYTVAVPGRIPLRNLHFSLVDVPDLRVIPPEHPQLQDIWMGAGPVPESLHRVLNVLAMARARFNLPSLLPLSSLFYKVLNLLKFGEHRGGMYVHAKGSRDGQTVEQSWHLLAEGDDGPYIPSMAIEGIVRKILAGTSPQNGARAATHALELSDYEDLFENRSIYAGFRQVLPASAPLYRRVLGPAFDHLPSQVQALHDDTKTRVWSGQATVTRGSGVLSRFIGWLFKFPPASDACSVSVELAPENGVERWTRNFDGQIFSSTQELGCGKNSHLIVERFGRVAVALAIVVRDEKLFLISRRWSVFGVPLPAFLLPSGNSFEMEKDGKFCFDVEIAAPIVGLIVAYRGMLDLNL